MLLLALTLSAASIIVGENYNGTRAGDVRLVNSYQDYEGIIEVFDSVENQWGPVCGYDIGYYEAEVICKQIGFTEGSSWYTSDGYDKFDDTGNYITPYSGYVYTDLDCDGTERRISECSFNRQGKYEQCGYESRMYGGIKCDTGYSSGGFTLSFNYFSWLIFFIIFIVILSVIRRNRQRGRCGGRQLQGQNVTHNVQGATVIVPPPSNTAYAPPPPGSYPTQQPVNGPPPQYNNSVPPGGAPYYPPQAGVAPYAPQGVVVPPPSNNPYATAPPGSYPTQQPADVPPKDGVPYAPQGGYPAAGSAPYPPPQGGVAPYPSQPGAPYPPQSGAAPGYPPPSNPAYPPADYAPNDTAPSMPPPSYESTIGAPGGGGGSSGT